MAWPAVKEKMGPRTKDERVKQTNSGQQGVAASGEVGRGLIFSLSRGPYLQHLDVEDEGLRVLLQGVQVCMTQGIMLVHLSDSTAMPLALQGVFALSDVAQALGYQWVEDYVLQEGSRGSVNYGTFVIAVQGLKVECGLWTTWDIRQRYKVSATSNLAWLLKMGHGMKLSLDYQLALHLALFHHLVRAKLQAEK
ncbi:hypothetical protein U0070_005169 [Myodes glareolus]|uniref:Uncharacterized protein n=1 Tax=Myodes glareolus TaxID=447135 RepID=A0AAW0IG40_MYOGA